jgi:dihydrofolate synthase / folylpolyglutamate synthase
MFTRVGSSAYRADLHNILALCELLHNPQNKFKSIHIAGTNGKGSSSHMLAAILQKAGYKTGLYTSPHLKDFRERIRVNGKMIPKKKVVDFVSDHKNNFENIQLSFFEMTVGLAFDHFVKEKIDIAVIEVGLGGRLDSTNIITPEVSLITNIGYDHMNILGDTLEKIAGEKAGIIKPGIPVVISQTQEETKNIFINTAKKNNSEIYFADQIWRSEIGGQRPDISTQSSVISPQSSDIGHQTSDIIEITVRQHNNQTRKQYQLDLTGNYQLKNIKGVLQTVEVLRQKGFQISEKNLRTALKNVKKITGLKGRWYTLSKDPLIICDTGHNEDGIKEILTQLQQTKFERLHWVFGMVNDKEVTKVLSLLPQHAEYYFCKASIPRAMDEKELQSIAGEFHLRGKSYSTVAEALEAAKNKAKKDDLILVGGSTFVVAEVL